RRARALRRRRAAGLRPRVRHRGARGDRLGLRLRLERRRLRGPRRPRRRDGHRQEV
ncbi:MAG: hypothetical protein AVDCRST_MAG30-4627, partial [uncultured Solirubrobacteraceae bacterium]